MKQFPYVKRQKDADALIDMLIAGAGIDPNPNDIKIMVEATKIVAYLMRYNADNQPNIMVDADKIVGYFSDKNKEALKTNDKWFSMFPLQFELRQRVLAATQQFDEEFGDGVLDVGILALEDALINHMIKTNDYSNLRSFIPNEPGVLNYVRYSVELTDYKNPPHLRGFAAVMNPNMDARVVIRRISGPEAEAGSGIVMYNQPYHSKGVLSREN